VVDPAARAFLETIEYRLAGEGQVEVEVSLTLLGGQRVERKARSGLNVRDELGRLILEAGAFDIRVSAKEITGAELMRLRSIVLTPVRE